MISGLSDVSLSPKTNYFFIFGDTKTPKQDKENPFIISKKNVDVNLKISEIHKLTILEKTGADK